MRDGGVQHGAPTTALQQETPLAYRHELASVQTTTRWETTPLTTTPLTTGKDDGPDRIPHSPARELPRESWTEPCYTLRGSPRILQLPVIAASLGSATDGQNTVVETYAARHSQHARRVQLKRGLVCLDGDGHRLLCHC